jgi:predicted Rossmann fold flavoprotein
MKKNKKKDIYTEQGEMLFTHFGISGPLVLSGSSYLHKFKDDEILISLDLKPALSEDKLEQRIIRDFEAFKTRELKNALGELLPRAMIPFVISKSGINPDRRVNGLSREEIKKLVYTFKNFDMQYDGLMGYDQAIITSGGISVKEIDPRTMELKKFSGIRVAGEVIDCDALTGGFNLQIAWSTAYLASR